MSSGLGSAPGARSDVMRLGMKVHCVTKREPPWQDSWAVELDGAGLLQLSAELLSLPEEHLTPRLRQMSRLLESVISRGLEERWADWDNGLGERNLLEMAGSTSPVSEMRQGRGSGAG